MDNSPENNALWPVPGRGEVSWSAEWLTDRMTAPAGFDYMASLREHPRLRLAFDGLSEGQDRRRLENAIEAGAAKEWLVPMPGRGFQLGAPLAVGAGGIAGQTAGTLLRAGGYAVINGGTIASNEVVQIEAVTPAGIVLAANTTKAHAAGSMVLPLFRALVSDMQGFQRFTGDVLPWRVEFILQEPVPIAPATDMPMHRGFPVFGLQHDWSIDPTWLPTREAIDTDNGMAPIWREDMKGHGILATTIAVSALDGAARDRMLAAIWALRGRAAPTWVESNARDMEVVATIGAGASHIDVADCGLPTGSRPPGRRDIAIHAGGIVITRQVTAVAQRAGGGHRLSLAEPIAQAVPVGTIARASWMTLSCLAADVVRINWWTSDVATATLRFQQVAFER